MKFKKVTNQIDITFSDMDEVDEKNLATILYEGFKAVKDRDLPFTWYQFIDFHCLHTLILFVQTYYNSHKSDCSHWDESVFKEAWQPTEVKENGK